MDKYILDANWFERADRIVAHTEVLVRMCYRFVSTVFLVTTINPRNPRNPPLLFETMVFGGPMDQFQVRYATREQALAGHALVVKKVT